MVHFFIGSLTQKILNSIHYDNTNMFAADRFCAVKPEPIGGRIKKNVGVNTAQSLPF
jgi:hypothetical protein